jgi:membrane protease YdiL (CAAX protease family)
MAVGAAAFLALPAASALRSVWLAPLLEETVLRLGVHDPLRRRLPGRLARHAPALAALVFAAAHLAFARGPAASLQAAATALPAWWIGRRYERAGHRLVPCIAWHAGFNLAWLCGLGALFRRAAGA